jgi:cytochrome c oxidase cbb3-type subunit 1
MNPAESNQVCDSKIDASCRVPLLVLFNGAALALVLGLLFSLIASLTFHNPEITAHCPFMTYGHTIAAANDLLVFGFAIPAALGVILWIFARLSQAELALPIVPFVAAHLWHLGVLVGTIGIFTGNSSGHQWLEYPRAAAALLGAAFVLIAISAFATFGLRKERELYPSHWFLLAALLVFPWIYSTAQLFVITNHPVRGVAQSVIGWWFANNLIFVWLALVGLGVAFYFLPKISNRPLHSRFYALFAFWTLILFGTWLGIPAGAPVPAWLPAVSQFAALLLIIPIITVIMIKVKSGGGVAGECGKYSYRFIDFGLGTFILSGWLAVAHAFPKVNVVTELTWFGAAQANLLIIGCATSILIGAIYYIVPRMMGNELPWKKFVGPELGLFILGVAVLVVTLVVAGVEQGKNTFDPAVAKKWLQISSVGYLLLLPTAFSLLVNLLVMTLKWKLGLVKTVIATVTAPLPNTEVKS